MIEVAAAVIQRPDGAYLLAQRPRGKVYAGYWEFPGGKVEAELQASNLPKTSVRKPVAPSPVAETSPAEMEPSPGPVETSPATSTPRRTAQER